MSRRLRQHLGQLLRQRDRELALAALTGAIVGLAAAGFDWVVAKHLLDRLYTLPIGLQVVAPVCGLALAALALRWMADGATPATSDEYIRNFHDPDRSLDLHPVLGRIVAAAATLGFGGTMGFEGPSIYMGAAIGTGLQRRFRRWFDPVDMKVLMVAGAAAGVAAIFKAPATGAIFAIEVPYQDDTAKRMLFPALVAAATGYTVFVAINGTTPLFPISGSPPFGLRELAGSAALGLLAGTGARGFAAMVRWAKRWQRRTHPLVSVAAGGAAMAGLAVASDRISGSALTLGSGYQVIAWVVQGPHALWAVALILGLRALATPATLAGGGAGGLFVPLVVLGALLGDLCGLAVHEPTQTLFPVIGVAAFLGAGYRTPLAAVVFVAEATGRPGFIVPGVIAAVAAQLVMGDESVSVYQQASRAARPFRRSAKALGSAVRTQVTVVQADACLDEVVSRHLGGAQHSTMPVVDGEHYVGLVRLEDLVTVPEQDWATTEVITVVPPDQPVVGPAWSLEEVARAMAGSDRNVLGVVDAVGRFVGLVTAADLVGLDDPPDGHRDRRADGGA